MPIHVIELEDDWNHTLHCPTCGTTVLQNGNETPCTHTLYIAHDEIEEPTHAQPDWRAALDANQDDDDLLGMRDRLEHAITQYGTPSMLHLAINVSGIACGPISTESYIGFEIAAT